MSKFLNELKKFFIPIQLASTYSLRDYEEWVELQFPPKQIESPKTIAKINITNYQGKSRLLAWIKR